MVFFARCEGCMVGVLLSWCYSSGSEMGREGTYNGEFYIWVGKGRVFSFHHSTLDCVFLAGMLQGISYVSILVYTEV